MVALGGAALGVATIGVGACYDCNGDICTSGLIIEITERDRAALAPGRWEFDVTLDGEETLHAACEVSSDSRNVSCEDSELFVWAMVWSDPNNPYTVYRIDFSGGDGLDGLPRELDITITHEGTAIVDEVFEPRYELAERKGCDPDCFFEKIAIVLERE